MRPDPRIPEGQNRLTSKGAVLLICLLLLAALTLLGLAAAWDHTLQERMSGNLLERAHAGHWASATLEWGESWVMGMPGTTRPTACSDACTPTDIIRAEGAYGPAPQYQGLVWWQNNAFTIGTDPVTGAVLDSSLAEHGAPGFWIIEEVHLDNTPEADSKVTETGYYRLLARGSFSEADWMRPIPSRNHCTAAPAINIDPSKA